MISDICTKSEYIKKDVLIKEASKNWLWQKSNTADGRDVVIIFLLLFKTLQQSKAKFNC